MLDRPILNAICASFVVYGIMYYVFEEKRKKENKKTSTYKNETVILTSLIAGLVTWYATTYYLNKDSLPVIIEENKQVFDNDLQSSSVTLLNTIANMNEEFNNIHTGGKTLENDKTIDVADIGLDIPKTDLKIPNVLIDYR